MLDPETEQYLTIGLWVLAAGWTVWLWLPIVVCACGGTTYANGGHEDPTAIEPDGSDPRYAELYADLVARGYEPVGPGFMRLGFHLRYWVYRTRVWAFRSRAGRRFAFLNESPAVPGWYQIDFATCYADGRLLLTVGGLGPTRTETDDFMRQSIPTDDPGRIEERHVRGEGLVEDEGWRRDPDLGLDTLLRATEQHSRVSTTRAAAALARKDLARIGLPMLLPAATLVGLFGVWHWAAPFVLWGEQLAYRFLLAYKQAGVALALRRRVEQERDSGW